MDEFDRSVSLDCPICGYTRFQFSDDDIVVCEDCGHKSTKSDLVEANYERIQQAIKQIGAEAVNQAKSKLSRAINKWK